MTHALVAVMVQLILLLMVSLGLPPVWSFGFAATLIYAMREITQAEYRWIEANGGLRAAMPFWKGLDVRLWNRHSVTDVIYPALATAAVAAIITLA